MLRLRISRELRFRSLRVACEMSSSRFKIWVGTFGIDVFIAFLFFGLWISLSGFPGPYILVLMVGYNILDTHTLYISYPY